MQGLHPPAKRRGSRAGIPNSAPSEPRPGSLNAQLAAIEVGGYRYLETPADTAQKLQSRIQGQTARLPDSMKQMRFTVAAFTAVAARGLGDVRVLVRVERTS